MKKQINKTKYISGFEGVYCTGFFMRKPSLITASSILFEKVHILNHLEFVINLAKQFEIKFSKMIDEDYQFIFSLADSQSDPSGSGTDPLSELNDRQKKTVNKYLFLARIFLLHYHELIPSVIETDLLPGGEFFNVELVEKNMPFKKNEYLVKENPFCVSTENTDQLSELIKSGGVPFAETDFITHKKEFLPQKMSSRQAAALLGMSSISLLLPKLKEVKPEIILEARDRLKDQLPPFWAAMLRLSDEYKKRIQNSSSLDEIQFECQELIDTIIRPSLIDLTQKMEKERKQWFYKILSPLVENMKVMIGKPPLTQQGLITAALSLGANISIDILEKQMLQNETKAGLTYILELGKIINE